MKQRRAHRTAGTGDANSVERSTAAKAAVALIAATPILATIGYGATEMWAYIPLAFLTALIVIFWIRDGLGKRGVVYSDSSLQLPLIGLIVIGLIQMLPFGGAVETGLLDLPSVRSVSLDPYATRFFTIRLVMLAIFFAAGLALISDRKLVKKFAIVIVIFGAVMAFAGILQRLASPDAIYGMRPTPQAIPFGPFVNQHHFAAFMEMTGGMTLGLLLGDVVERNKKALLMIALLLMIIAVGMTGSRGGLISTLGAAAFILFAHFYLTRRHSHESAGRFVGLKIAGVGAGILVAVAAAVVFLSGADPLVRGLGMQAGDTDVSSGRTHFWSVAVKIFLDNPIIGAGYDAFGTAFTKYDTWNGFFRVEQAHNDYLQALADGGVMAFACVAAFIVLLFKRGVSVIKNSTSPTRRSIAIGALGGCVGILIHSFFDFPLRTPSNAFFFLLLVVLATAPLGDEKAKVAE
ncbi:MAG: O-antigen ligase family protein [Acidobacteria bacterium]|nr:O-antigen ligase family protein [Acidobacteriota bacterium]